MGEKWLVKEAVDKFSRLEEAWVEEEYVVE